MYHHTIEDFNHKSLTPGIDIKSLTGEKMSMVVFYIAAGAEVPEHSHPHEQIGTVLKGSLELTIGDEKKIVKPGDAWCVPSNVVHRAQSRGEAVEVLECFSPPREDYK